MSSTSSSTRGFISSNSILSSTESLTIELRSPLQAEDSPDRDTLNVRKTHRKAAAWLILALIYNNIVEVVPENNNIPIPVTCWDNNYNGDISFASTFVKYFIDEKIFPLD